LSKKKGNREELERLRTKVRNQRQEFMRIRNTVRSKKQKLTRVNEEISRKRAVLKQVTDEFRSVLPYFEHFKEQPENLRSALQHVARQQKKIIKNQQLKMFQLEEEISRLKRELRTATEKDQTQETLGGRSGA